MDQILASNNTAVRFLLEAGFSQFHKAEHMLHKAMAALSDESRLCNSAPVTAANEEQHPKVPVRPSRDSISSRRSSAFSTAAVCSLSGSLDDSYICMEDMDMDISYDDGDEIQVLAVESVELTQVDPQQSGSEHSALPVFNRALLLNDTAEEEEIGAAILYNLALIHHIKGLHLGQPDAVHKALKLYELAIRILQHNTTTTSPSNQMTVDELLVLALFYNLGQASAHFMSFDKAGCYFDFLRSVLGDDQGAAYLVDDDHSFFFFNAMFFQGERLTVAPAA